MKIDGTEKVKIESKELKCVRAKVSYFWSTQRVPSKTTNQAVKGVEEQFLRTIKGNFYTLYVCKREQ